MPELPEVETVCRGLRAQILGRRIEGVEVRNAAVIHQNLAPEEFAARLIGRSICGVERRGKYILIVLDQGWLVCHLRMTGKLLVRAQEAAPELHTHVVFALDGGLALHYNDVRRFGGFTWSDSDPRAAVAFCARAGAAGGGFRRSLSLCFCTRTQAPRQVAHPRPGRRRRDRQHLRRRDPLSRRCAPEKERRASDESRVRRHCARHKGDPRRGHLRRRQHHPRLCRQQHARRQLSARASGVWPRGETVL